MSIFNNKEFIGRKELTIRSTTTRPNNAFIRAGQVFCTHCAEQIIIIQNEKEKGIF